MLQSPVCHRQRVLQQDGQGEREPGVGHQVSSHMFAATWVPLLFVCMDLFIGLCLFACVSLVGWFASLGWVRLFFKRVRK